MSTQRHQRGLLGIAFYAITGGLLGLAFLATVHPHFSPLRIPKVSTSREHGLQEGTWTTYANGDAVQALAVQGDYLWAGTHFGGVVRWKISDKTYTQYLYPQTGLPSNEVQAIDIDALGRVWIGTDRGLAVLTPDDAIVAHHTENSGLPADSVTDIAVALDGKVWVATDGGGVAVLDDGGTTEDLSDDSWMIYDLRDGLPSYRITTLDFDEDRNVWIGTRPYPNPDPEGPATIGGGVCIFDGISCLTYTTENSALTSNSVTAACADDDGATMWITAVGGGITRFWKVRGSVYSALYMTGQTRRPNIPACTQDAAGRMWFAMPGLGAGMFDGTTWTFYRPADSPITSAHIFAIATDIEGRIWFGAQGFGGGPQGISLLNGSTWDEYITAARSLASNRITDIAFGADGNVWVATDRGLSALHEGAWTTYSRASTNNGLASDRVRSIAIEEDGQVWIGTLPFAGGDQWAGGGISVFDPRTGSWTTYNKDNTGPTGLGGNWIQKIAIDAAGRVWIGTGVPAGEPTSALGYGLTLYDHGSWTTYTRANTYDVGLSSDRIADIAFDSLGRIWLATQPTVIHPRVAGGVSRLDLGDNGVPDPPSRPGTSDDSWTFWTSRNSDLVASPDEGYGDLWAIHVDQGGIVWAGGWYGAEASIHWWRRQGISGALNQFIDPSWTAYEPFHKSGPITSIASDAGNNLWVGTAWDGARYFDGRSWQSFTTADYPLASNDITVIGVDPQGDIWFGTADGGISRFSPPLPPTPTPTRIPTATAMPTSTPTIAPERLRLLLPMMLKNFP